MAAERETADREDGNGDGGAKRRVVGVELPGDHDTEGARDRRDRVELGVGADKRGRLACDDIAQDAAANGRRDA